MLDTKNCDNDSEITVLYEGACKIVKCGNCENLPKIPKSDLNVYERPICGSDQQTYKSDCALKKSNCELAQNVTKIHDGECLGPW